MAKKGIDPETYTTLLEAYRGLPKPVHKTVSETTGIPYRTCHKAFTQGWPKRKDLPEGGRAIKDVLTGEGVLARAALAREEKGVVVDRREVIKEQLRDAQLAATADLIDSRAKQGKTIRASRVNAGGLLVLSGRMIKEGENIVESLRTDIQRLISQDRLDLQTKLSILTKIGSFAKTSTEIARMTEQMEALALGDPKAILDMMEKDDGMGMSDEECIQVLQDTKQAYERSEASGVIQDAEFTDVTVEGKPDVE